MSGRRLIWPGVWSVVLAAAIAAPTSSCLEPTEIVLRITTDVPASTIAAPKQAHILIGAPETVLTNPSTSVPTNPVDATGSFGDLVVVPNGNLGASVAIRVQLGVTVPTSQCDQTPSGCVVASRTIRYVQHRRLEVPIDLQSSCLGVSCDPTQTCVGGKCVDNTIDTNACDGGTCGPTSLVDATSLDVSPIPDVGVPEATTACQAPSKICGSTCTKVLTDPANCGDCGIDCTGGTCSNGTCLLNASLTGKCLAVYNGDVYVMSLNGTLATVSTHGGLSTPYPLNGTGVDLTSIGTDWAYSTNATGYFSVFDQAKSTTYSLNNIQATRIALDDLGFSWIDESTGGVGFDAFSSGAPLTRYTFPAPTSGYIASAHGTVYVSLKGSQLCEVASNTPICIDANTPPYIQSPTGVAVSDPTSTSPSVFAVENGTTIVKLPSNLSSRTTLATAAAGLQALAYDGATSTAYAISPVAIVKSSTNSTLTTVVTTTNATTRCLAVDATSVYWLDAGGVYKHAK